MGRQEFEQLYASVCEARGWGCSPNSVEVEFDDGRRQVVRLDFFEHEGAELVRFHSVIGSTERIRADRLSFALRLNFGLPHGSLAVRDDMLVMVDTMLLAGADASEVEAVIAYLAETADYYERTMFGPDAH